MGGGGNERRNEKNDMLDRGLTSKGVSQSVSQSGRAALHYMHSVAARRIDRWEK